MPSSENKKDVLREWRESAPYWATHANIVRTMFAPITSAIIEAGAIGEGQIVLDVAGGAGEPSLTVSSVVGDSGSVFFTDAVIEMITTARSQGRQTKRTNIEYAQCVAERLPFFGDSFDAVISRLGVMLFPDPIAAIREALRVVKSRGSVSYAVWSGRDSNPFFKVVADAVAVYIESPPEDPDAPGAFRFAGRGKLARVLAETGFVDVSELLLNFNISATLTPDQFWSLRVELSDTLRGKVAQLTSDQLETVKRGVEAAGRPFFVSGQMNFPAQVLVVTAMKP